MVEDGAYIDHGFLVYRGFRSKFTLVVKNKGSETVIPANQDSEEMTL
jgi:hypothetical protein